MMLYPMTVKCTRCHLVSARNRRINRLSVNDNMFFYPEIRDENSRLGQRCLAQDARIKVCKPSQSLGCICIGVLNIQRYCHLTSLITGYWLPHIGHQLREFTGCDRFYWLSAASGSNHSTVRSLNS